MHSSNCAAGVTLYSYDAENRRVTKASGGQVTRYILDGIHEIEERNAAGLPTRQYVYGNQVDEVLSMDTIQATPCPPDLPPPVGPILTPILSPVLTPLMGTCDSVEPTPDGVKFEEERDRYYYHATVLGSIYAVTNQAKKNVEAYRYSAYGIPTVIKPGANGEIDYGGDDVLTTNGTSAIGNEFMFDGRRWDPESRVFYYRARTYDPSIGRFVSLDVEGTWHDQLNLGNGFGYAGMAPQSNTDPSGKATLPGNCGPPPRRMCTGGNGGPIFESGCSFSLQMACEVPGNSGPGNFFLNCYKSGLLAAGSFVIGRTAAIVLFPLGPGGVVLGTVLVVGLIALDIYNGHQALGRIDDGDASALCDLALLSVSMNSGLRPGGELDEIGRAAKGIAPR